jgi:hypothetical protein
MKIPSLEEAKVLVTEAEQRNPGAWVNHSLFAAKAAEAIALGVPGLDPRTAFILGYLHDIGRREGVTQMRHVLDGFNFLVCQGYDDAARVCLTHSFPVKNVRAIVGTWDDCPLADLGFIQNYLDQIEYNAYDKLIQLCDALALPSGFCLMEKRLVDVTLRYGINEYTLLRWRAYLGIQNEFEKVLNKSIYDCLPGVVENTFRTNLLSIGELTIR